MRYSEIFLPTIREVPSDAEIISHQLMIRTGMISALVINPGQKPGRFRKMILISPIIK